MLGHFRRWRRKSFFLGPILSDGGNRLRKACHGCSLASETYGGINIHKKIVEPS